MQPGFEHRFNNGDIVYWSECNPHEVKVCWGMVDEQFSDAVCIDLLRHYETRLVNVNDKLNMIPINDFPNTTEWFKLPKCWTWNTRLYVITFNANNELESKCNQFRVDNPEDIKYAYELGYFVKANTIEQCVIDSEITRDGYRIIKKYPSSASFRTRTSIRPDKVYFTYAEAKAEVDEYQTELQRQSALTDKEWSIEQIDKTLNHWKAYYKIADDTVLAYRTWLLNLENVEDVEIRLWSEDIQWKYCNKKRWNWITL